MLKGLEAIYEELLKHGLDVMKEKYKEVNLIHVCDEEGSTMLHYAVWDNEYTLVQSLVQSGACPLVENRDGLKPVVSAGSRKCEILDYLVGEFENSLTECDKSAILAQAAAIGVTENVKYLLNKRFDSSAFYRESPILKWAIQSQNIEIIRLLCEAGAKLDDCDETGETALYEAAMFGELEIAEYLLDCGADTDKPADGGYTPLICASSHDQPEMVKLLLARGANVDFITEDGTSALLHAIEYGNVEVAKVLLNYGADKMRIDNSGEGMEDYVRKIRSKKVIESMRRVLEHHSGGK